MEERNHMQNAELGTIVKISGPVLDVQFPAGIPALHNLLSTEDGVHMEVAAHLSAGLVRAIALEGDRRPLLRNKGSGYRRIYQSAGGKRCIGPRCQCAWGAYR